MAITDPDAYRDYVEYGQHLANTPKEKRVPLSQALDGYHPEMKAEVLRALSAYDAADNRVRSAPFQEYLTKEQVCDYYDVDPKLAQEVYQKTWDEELTACLIDRMGSDAIYRSPPAELSLREQVAAAYDVHSQEE